MAKIDTASAINQIRGKTNGKSYHTPWSWKFNSLQYEYKQTHPFQG